MKLRTYVASALAVLFIVPAGSVEAGARRGGPQQEPRLEMYEPTPAAVQDLQAIMDALRVPFPIAFAAGNVPNAAATILSDEYGRPARVVLYNRAFMNQLAGTNPWAPISVLAHEVGHHIGGHPIRQGYEHSWSHELDADRVSGCALALLGASTEDAMAAQNVYFDATGSSSHPRTRLRLRAIVEGWQACKQ